MRQRGFTLLEAIVALVLIGGVGLAVFGWLNQSLTTLARIEDANARSAAQENVLQFLEAVNPMSTPEGRFSFGDYTARWKAEPLTPTVDGAGVAGESLYALALYSTKVVVERGGAPDWISFEVRQVGYKQVRFPPKSPVH